MKIRKLFYRIGASTLILGIMLLPKQGVSGVVIAASAKYAELADDVRKLYLFNIYEHDFHNKTHIAMDYAFRSGSSETDKLQRVRKVLLENIGIRNLQLTGPELDQLAREVIDPVVKGLTTAERIEWYALRRFIAGARSPNGLVVESWAQGAGPKYLAMRLQERGVEATVLNFVGGVTKLQVRVRGDDQIKILLDEFTKVHAEIDSAVPAASLAEVHAAEIARLEAWRKVLLDQLDPLDARMSGVRVTDQTARHAEVVASGLEEGTKSVSSTSGK